MFSDFLRPVLTALVSTVLNVVLAIAALSPGPAFACAASDNSPNYLVA